MYKKTLKGPFLYGIINAISFRFKILTGVDFFSELYNSINSAKDFKNFMNYISFSISNIQSPDEIKINEVATMQKSAEISYDALFSPYQNIANNFLKTIKKAIQGDGSIKRIRQLFRLIYTNNKAGYENLLSKISEEDKQYLYLDQIENKQMDDNFEITWGDPLIIDDDDENDTAQDILSSLDLFHSTVNPFYIIAKSILTSNSCDDLYNKIKDGAFFEAVLNVAALYYAPVRIVVSASDLKKAVDSGDKMEILLAALGLTLETFKLKMKNIKNTTKQGDAINQVDAEKLLLKEVKTLNQLPNDIQQNAMNELLGNTETTFIEIKNPKIEIKK